MQASDNRGHDDGPGNSCVSAFVESRWPRPAYHIPCRCMVVMVLSMAAIPSLLFMRDQFPALAAAF